MRSTALVLPVVGFLLSFVACAAPDDDSAAASSDELEVAAARLSCEVTSDPCSAPSFGGCVESVTMKQSPDGSALVTVKYGQTSGGKKTVKLIGRSGFDEAGKRLPLSGPSINGHLDRGASVSGMVDLQQSSAKKYRGTITLPAIGEETYMTGFGVSCTRTGNAACRYGARELAIGERIPDVDGCNTCSCSASGLACTELACAPSGCMVDGQRHAVGASWPSPDGCNTCSCSQSGHAFCTEIACR